ncbi:hypothetical protein [Bacillus subtilis]|uniref:Uncharacterized protein n=1 Tax=Bacillus subtilis subsp. subtilis TaxID=135461 RepID=A0ABD3ZSW9_BACIU|nr:hypothetical protein [Bacillus subtilis]KIL31220.1 hypothetical protein B4067_3120 [Bacillus subtilis subsp. subtilis]KIN56888.1 hypothetical protein B4145_4612 [Bacillus subtilis]MEC2233837.1 hypothetical protein [Bacillus subtilis]PLV35320.1 hypothetical protein BSP2_37520 [Bacillus subtilis subsp. subtilis]
MGVVRKFIFGDFACIETEREFVLIMKNKIYGPYENSKFKAMLYALEYGLKKNNGGRQTDDARN